MTLTDSETATILAALRHWQSHIRDSPDIIASLTPHFETVKPLDSKEIDSLCERINFHGWIPASPARMPDDNLSVIVLTQDEQTGEAYHEEDTWFWVNTAHEINSTVTHWQHLPDPL